MERVTTIILFFFTVRTTNTDCKLRKFPVFKLLSQLHRCQCVNVQRLGTKMSVSLYSCMLQASSKNEAKIIKMRSITLNINANALMNL